MNYFKLYKIDRLIVMELTEFFKNFSSICAHRYPIICFTGKEYQSLFFEKLQKFFEQQTGQSIKKINTEQDLAEVQVALASTFLGQTHWYSLGNLGAISSKKKRADYLRFVISYKGPHRLLVFIPEADKTTIPADLIECEIQATYTSDQVKKISILYEDEKPEVAAYFFSKLYRIKKEYSLDQLCLLKEYAKLLGKNMNEFFNEWIEKLIVSDVSLFHLSQLFFEKNAAEFFSKWQQVRENYSDQFWTSYFSEQLFKAYFVVEHGGFVPSDQKQLQFGLSFSFLKHDWKLYGARELKYAHQKMYEIDLSLKSGGSPYQLDSFFISFFNGVFS